MLSNPNKWCREQCLFMMEVLKHSRNPAGLEPSCLIVYLCVHATASINHTRFSKCMHPFYRIGTLTYSHIRTDLHHFRLVGTYRSAKVLFHLQCLIQLIAGRVDLRYIVGSRTSLLLDQTKLSQVTQQGQPLRQLTCPEADYDAGQWISSTHCGASAIC